MTRSQPTLSCTALLTFALLFSAAGPAGGEVAPGPGTYDVRPITGPIRIDGRLDDAGWRDATTIPLAYEWYPGDNVEPPVRTEARITHDGERLYVAFRAQDPDPSAIRAHLMDRDSVVTFAQDDHVTLLLDPFDDQRRAFQFRVNPLGVQVDALFSQVEFVEDVSWDVIWTSAGRLTDTGYEVEMAIPFDQIRFPETDASGIWRMQLGRSYPRDARHRISSNPRDRDNTCLLCQLDRVAGFEGLRPGLQLEVTPTLTAARTDRRIDPPGGELEAGPEDLEPGLTASWGVTPGVTLNATLNPDFSQVEADAVQLRANERFAIFLPEKRPFFLEGVDLFATPIDAVFTRTVVDPDWGVKLSGKRRAHAGGAFVTWDEITALLIPANQGSINITLNQPLTSGVLRYRRDIGDSSTLGLLYTGREGDGYRNHLAGLDAFLRLGPSDEVRIQYLRSTTDYPDEVATSLGQPSGSFDGAALSLDYTHTDRDWLWGVVYDDLEPEFRADSGFVPRVDLRRLEGRLARRFWGGPEDRWLTAKWGARALYSENHRGLATDKVFEVMGEMTGPRQSSLAIAGTRSYRRVLGVEHDKLWAVAAALSAQPTSFAKMDLRLEGGETVDFIGNRAVDYVLWGPSLELKPGRRLNVRLSHLSETLEKSGRRLSRESVSSLRLVYNLSLRSFLRGIVQRRSVRRDAALFTQAVDSEVERWFSQILFSYKLNARTALFLGYSDDRLGLETFSPVQTGRTFFIKLGYAWDI